MPDVYKQFGEANDQQYKTRYLVPVGDTTLFTGSEPLRIAGYVGRHFQHDHDRRGSSGQGCGVDQARRFRLRSAVPNSGSAGVKDGWLHVAMADGSVRSLPTTMDPKLLSTLYTRAAARELIGKPCMLGCRRRSSQRAGYDGYHGPGRTHGAKPSL